MALADKLTGIFNEMTTARDYECHTVTITKRAADQLRNVSRLKGRTIEDLMEAAIEDACILSEREYPLP